MSKLVQNQIDEFYEHLPEGRCKGCQYARAVVATGQWMFLGCYHEPYRGKWTCEIKYCPKEQLKEEQNES